MQQIQWFILPNKKKEVFFELNLIQCTVYNTGKWWIMKYVWSNEATLIDLVHFWQHIALPVVAQMSKKFHTSLELELLVTRVSRIGSEVLANQPAHLRSQNFAKTVIFICFSIGKVLWCSVWLLSKHWPCSRPYSEERSIFIRNKYSLWCLGKYMDSYSGAKGIK